MTLLLLGSALMLIVAACDSGDDESNGEDSNGESTEMTSESDQETGDEETAVPEEDDSNDEATEEPAGTEDSETSSEDDATNGNESDSAEGTPAESSDEVAESGESEGESDTGDSTPEANGTPGADDEEALDPEEVQPGPEEGMFFDIDFEEANELTPFELVEPETVPEGVEFQSIMGLASPEASEEERSEEATTVTFSYAQAAGEDMMQGLPVEFTQTSEMDMTQNLPPESEQEEMTIGDREVTQVRIQTETQDEIIAYMWGEGDVYYSIAAILGPDLEESELEEMVASVPSAG